MGIRDDLFTIEEFCAAVRISRRHYYTLRQENLGPRVIMLGGRVLISSEETKRWLADRTERKSFYVG